MKVLHSTACDACGSPMNEKDQAVCAKCRGRSKAARAGVRVGQRVKVVIKAPGEYAAGCAESLEGMTGSVEEVKDRVYEPEATRVGVLVKFDRPARKWWTNQTPTTAFWVPLRDLEVLA